MLQRKPADHVTQKQKMGVLYFPAEQNKAAILSKYN